jgi:hypothetical protein
VRKLNTITGIFIFLLIIYSCSQGYSVNMEDKTKYPEGRNLYLSKCGGCHQLSDPSNHTKLEWDKIMITMQQKSKINDEQKNEIINWLIETQQSVENVEAKQ